MLEVVFRIRERASALHGVFISLKKNKKVFDQLMVVKNKVLVTKLQ